MAAIELTKEHIDSARAISLRVARGLPISPEDAISAGYLKLAEAANSFDPARGIPFESYAWRLIEGGVKTEAAANRRTAAREMACGTCSSSAVDSGRDITEGIDAIALGKWTERERPVVEKLLSGVGVLATIEATEESRGFVYRVRRKAIKLVESGR